MTFIARLNTRAALLIAAAALFFVTVAFFTGQSFGLALLVIGSDGLAAGLWIVGACGLGLVCIGRRTASESPLLRLATAGAIGLAIFSLAALGLGLRGVLNRPVALAMPMLGAVAWIVKVAWQHRQWLASSPTLSLNPLKKWLAQPANQNWLWLIPVLSLAIACVGASVLPGLLWKPLDPHPYDVVTYHLQVPREWYELGRILPLQHNVFSYFPFNVEMQYLLAMHAAGGPWAGMYMCQFINVGMTVLLVLAVAGSGRGGLVAAAVVAAVPWVIMLSCVAYVEAGFLLYSTLALVWALKWLDLEWHGRPARAEGMGETPMLLGKEIVLAGVFAGVAAGVKITAVPMLLLPIAIGLLVVHWRTNRKAVVIATIAFLTIAGVVLSPWLIRNLIWAGNPLFPLAMKLLGHAHFTPVQMERFRLAHSPRPNQAGLLPRLKILWNDVLVHWQYGFVLLPAGAFAACRKNWRSLFLWINAAVVLIVWLGFTHLLPRFAISLVPIAAIALAAVEWKLFKFAGIALAIVAPFAGLISTSNTLKDQTTVIAANNLFGVEKINFETVEDVDKLDPEHSKSVAMIGDASAFLVQLPMSRLRYRGVFDLPGDITDPIDCWAGPGVRGNADWLLAIHPAEIDRLHQTYIGVPALPAKLAGTNEEPYVVPATEVR